MHVCSTENVFIERNVIKRILPNTKEYRKILILADDFADGGGDSHIRIYGIDYVEITDYRDTPKKLEFLLK